MKILMIGLGSIGQRHVRNIRRLLGETAEIIAYRTRGMKLTFTDRLEIRDGVDLEQEYGITSYTSLEEALAQKPEVAFITTITARHLECALQAAAAGCHLFIEKPLADSLQGTQELTRLVKERGVKVFLGFQNRYHPCVTSMKAAIDAARIGTVTYAACEFSERLTTMHRYEDYRMTYMARKDMGGGPVLNLQMHDLDILQWIFGMPAAVSAQMQTRSALEIDVEESASALFRFGHEGGLFPVYAHTDFLQFPPVHRFKVIGTQGRIEADLNAAHYVLYVGDEVAEEWEDASFERNRMFMQELEDFFAYLEPESEDAAASIGLADGVSALRMAEGIRRAAGERREIRLSEI